MAFYNNFVGIDIGKFNFVVATYDIKNTIEYENTPTGIADFLNDNREILKNLYVFLKLQEAMKWNYY